MTVTIAEEVLLLAYSEDGMPLITWTQLDPALAGAILAELAIRGRVELSDEKVTLKDASPLGDAELDAALARIASESTDGKPVWWIQQLRSAELRGRLLSRLAESGVLSEQREKAIIFTTTRWPETDPSVKGEVRDRVHSVLAGADPDARTAALIAIAHAAKLDRRVFPEASEQRINEIVTGAWAGDAVARTVISLQAAATAASAAVIAATTAATGVFPS
ncbi:GOLPH3/VPS74 family protein [Nonomuraea sp. CA-141351]|uniref:GOLPH3/VPS74 family protein n=1 Tax=Nonomuraea sp. CA-141351 TaxID=3239996 RepID=UPI003D906515